MQRLCGCGWTQQGLCSGLLRYWIDWTQEVEMNLGMISSLMRVEINSRLTISLLLVFIALVVRNRRVVYTFFTKIAWIFCLTNFPSIFHVVKDYAALPWVSHPWQHEKSTFWSVSKKSKSVNNARKNHTLVLLFRKIYKTEKKFETCLVVDVRIVVKHLVNAGTLIILRQFSELQSMKV